MTDNVSQHQSALKVSIRPHQSSFFAGEHFVCDITFTNTNTRLVQDTQHEIASSSRLDISRAASISNGKAGISHSKSQSVDVRAHNQLRGLSDSPADGLTEAERAKSVWRELNGQTLPMRKHLIGKGEPIASSKQSFLHPWTMQSHQQSVSTSPRHSKSASLSASKPKTSMGLGHPTAPPNLGDLRGKMRESSSSPTPPSRVSSLSTPGRRVPSAPIASQHPHSRKKSMAQIQAEDLTEAFELDHLDSRLSSRTSSTPTTPGVTGGPSDFFKQGRNDTMESVFRDSVNDWSQSAKRQSNGQGFSPIYPTADMLPVDHEKILWSFVQIGGTVEIDESLIKPVDFENLKRRLAYGDISGVSPTPDSVNGTSRTIGGGDLGHTDASEQLARRAGWTSYLRGPFGSGVPNNRHSRTGSTLQDNQERTLQSRAVPTFATPPSILAVDLTLAPGESKTYSFTIQLPVDLPPSYHGKAIRFKYSLTLGTNRLDTESNMARTQKSRLIQIPVRIYNHVGTSGFRPFYDLMNPVILTKEEATVLAQQQSNAEPPHDDRKRNTRQVSAQQPSLQSQQLKKTELEAYTKTLLDTSVQQADAQIDVEKAVLSSSTSLHALDTCKTAVELLARTSTKVSYDISKDGKVAAVLTLIKSKYRLGDTVVGVISINEKGSMARIARVSATLETYEEVQPSIATLPVGRMSRATKVIHAEHHESVLDKGRANFSLPIPSGAAPEFVTSGVKLNWLVRLSFLTISSTNASNPKAPQSTAPPQSAKAASRRPPLPHLIPGPSDGYSRYHIALTAIPSLAGSAYSTLDVESTNTLAKLGYASEIKLETVECAVPVTILPNSTGFQVRDAEFYA